MLNLFDSNISKQFCIMIVLEEKVRIPHPHRTSAAARYSWRGHRRPIVFIIIVVNLNALFQNFCPRSVFYEPCNLLKY